MWPQPAEPVCHVQPQPNESEYSEPSVSHTPRIPSVETLQWKWSCTATMWVSRAFGGFCATSDGTWARRSHISCVRGSCVYLAISEALESKYLNPSVGVAPAQSYLGCPKPSVHSAQTQPKNSKCMNPKRGVGSPQSLPGFIEPSVTSLLPQPDTDLEGFKQS